MPIYEYACMECESHFEELVRNAEQAVACPDCGAGNVLKQFSSFAVAGVSSQPRFGSSGGSGSGGGGGGGGGGGCCGGGCGC
ncbi:MAG: zinc ribbon domain-containing protein [Actinomycetota bacterium]|nr:zinc ribbon domain-containing protein [Actinomycetota bacterium]